MATHEPTDYVHVNGQRFSVHFTEDQLQARIRELGEVISRDFEDKQPILIGVLNGAFMFLADLMREITIPCEMDFMKLSSYGAEKISSGTVEHLKRVDAHLEGRHVIVVEDIVDTGLSMQFIMDRMRELNPASVSTAVLLHKPDATRVDGIDLDYVGFEIPNIFVLGYGLDYAQKGRNLRHLYILDEAEQPR
jgi:hypoxanthine phosphoribosyltransferase